jgi:hypothetical protein
MTNDTQHPNEDFLEEDFESVSHCHLLAAEHFQMAAQHHAQAAQAHDAGNLYESHRRGYLAYRHQLLGTQYAEMAAVEDEDAFEEDDETGTPEQPET